MGIQQTATPIYCKNTMEVYSWSNSAPGVMSPMPSVTMEVTGINMSRVRAVRNQKATLKEWECDSKTQIKGELKIKTKNSQISTPVFTLQ